MKINVHRLAFLALVTWSVGCSDTPDVEVGDQALAAAAVAITTDMAAYSYASPVTVSYSGLDGAAQDWVAIAPQGSPPTTTTRWAFTGGGASGSKTFEGPTAGGTYVARAFDSSANLLAESAPFTTADPSQTMATVAPSQGAYSMIDPITINWSGLPGNPQDWIAIAPAGFPDNNQAEWRYTTGGVNGSVTFTGGFQLTGYPAGSYVARAYLNGTYVKVAESAVFTIGTGTAPSVITTASQYTTVDPIKVVWNGLSGNPKDWVALAPSGAAPTVVSTWAYTNGSVSGNQLFNVAGTIAAGTYVARVFGNDSYSILAESQPFTVVVASSPTVTTDLATYAVGQPIVITWTGLSAVTTDWVSYAPAGSTDATATRWVYTGGATSSSSVLDGAPSPGTYVARAYVNGTYTKVAESAVFTVQ